jgi:hypothetical protein
MTRSSFLILAALAAASLSVSAALAQDAANAPDEQIGKVHLTTS